MIEKTVCELPKNAREVIHFRLAEFKGHQFVDLRIYTKEDGKDPAPTKKGLAVSPQLWPQFRQALDLVEAELVSQGWLDQEDLEGDAPAF
jgi:hypothetical protein